jgi:predicted RNA-binding protein YlqC (UPF0109 family)
MKELIEFIVKNLVDKPGEVMVNEIDGERTVIFELIFDRRNIGKFMGQGRLTARSLTLLRQS